MAGWNLRNGSITEYKISEDRIWSLFNFVFSDSSKKRNTYKFGLIKSLIDNAFNGDNAPEGVFYSYEELFGHFARNYWNLVVKYDLRQMRKDGKSELSKVETIIKEVVEKEKTLNLLEYDAIPDAIRNVLVKRITTECKKCVVGALYEDFDGVIYSFDLSRNGILLNHKVHEFIMKYKMELERLNYYSWAKFLEQVNNDNALIRVIEKLELSTPRRNDLSVYRELLKKEFEENTCFYCGAKLKNNIHVDHFIPWSFVKDDKIWNFVLACSTCNERKNNKVPSRDYLTRLIARNKKVKSISETIIQTDFNGYSDDILENVWSYAKLSGLKEFG